MNKESKTEINKPLSFNEISKLDEELCEYCHCTDYGAQMGAYKITAYSPGCEGSWCEEAYENYLENFEEVENE